MIKEFSTQSPLNLDISSLDGIEFTHDNKATLDVEHGILGENVLSLNLPLSNLNGYEDFYDGTLQY